LDHDENAPAGDPADHRPARADPVTLDAAPRDRLPGLRWIDRFSMALAVVGGIATVGLMVNVVADVAGRALANRPLPGTVDLTASVWMPTLVSLGLGYALLRAEHIRVNLLTAATGPRTQRLVEIVGMTITLAVASLFLFFGAESAADSMSLGESTVGTPWLLVGPFRLVTAIGLVGLALQSIAQLLRAATVAQFVPADDDEVAVALAPEEDVFDEVGNELARPLRATGSTERPDAR
jgi:TRAP-type mannitol/chloroaromatic compound transport system permease small subunit